MLLLSLVITYDLRVLDIPHLVRLTFLGLADLFSYIPKNPPITLELIQWLLTDIDLLKWIWVILLIRNIGLITTECIDQFLETGVDASHLYGVGLRIIQTLESFL